MNKYAVSTDGIASALQRAGSALTTAGNDIDESTAMIAAANTVVQDPEKVGNGLRTIALRLTGTKAAAESLQEMGEETEGMIQTESKLRKTIMDATKTASNPKGFDILTDSGQYKSTYEIIQGIADIWEEIGEMDRKTGNTNQNLLLETMAGKNRANILAAMLQSPDILRSAFVESQNSEGSAQEELDKYLESMEGRIQRFKNATQELSTDLLNSDLLKFFVDLGTTGVKALDSLTGGLNAFSLGLSALMTIGTKKAGWDLLQYDPSKEGIHKLQPIWAQLKNRGGAIDLENTDANYGKFINSMRQADKATVTFSGHYEDLLRMGSIKKIDLAEEFRKDIAEGGNYHNVFDDSLEGYNAWYKAVKSGNDSLKQSFASIGKTIGNIALSGLMSMGITAGIQLIMTGINYAVTYAQRVSDAGKEARNAIDEITKATQDANNSIRQMGDTSRQSFTQTDSTAKNVKESIESLTQRYIELRRGTENNANLSLSDSEYEEFLNIGNKMASILPELQRGTDASGNAILNLGGNASEAAEQVKSLYDNYLRLQHAEVEEKFAPAIEGLEVDLKRIAGKTPRVSLTAEQAQKYLSTGLDGGLGFTNDLYGFDVDWKDYIINGEEIAQANRENTEMVIASSDWMTEEAKEEMRRNAEAVETQMRAMQQKAATIFSYSSDLVTTSEAFENLNYDLRQDLSATFLDAKDQWLELWTASGEDSDIYSDALYERIIAPLSRISEDSTMQDQLYNLMHLDLSEMKLDDVQAEYSSVLSSIFGSVYEDNTDLYNRLFDLDKYTDIEKKFASRFANSDLFTSQNWDDIKANFSLADMETAYEVLINDNDHLIDSYEKLKQAIQDAQQEALAETSYLNDYAAAHGRAHSAQYDSVKDAVATEAANMARGIRDENYSKLIGGADLTTTISTAKTPIARDYDGMAQSISTLQGELKAFNAVRAEGIKQNADYDFSLDRVLFGNIDLSKTERKIEWTKDTVEQYKDALTSWGLTDIIDNVEKGNKEFSTVLGSRETFYTKNGDAIDVAFSPVMVDGQTGKLLKRNEVMDYIQNKVIGTFDSAGEVTLKAVLDIDKNDQNGKRLIADIGDNASITDQIMHFMGVDGSIQTAVQDMLPYFNGLTMSAEQFNQFLSSGAVNLYSMFETFDSQQRAMTYFTDDGLGVYAFMKDALEATKGVEDLDGVIVDVGKDGKTSFKKSAKAINELSARLNISTESAGYLLDAARDIGAVDIGTIYAQAGKNTLNGFLSDLQAVATAMSDISSKGYMTYDSITNLVTANGAYAEGLVNTSSGMIVNNEVMQELNEQAAQFATADLQGSIDQLQRRYEANNDTLDSYRDKNINVIDVIDKVKKANGELTDAFDETDAHFQDYQKIWAAYSENTSIGANIEDLRRQQSEIRASVSLMQEYRNALTTANMNANYLTTQSGMEGAQKLYNQGWVGTDDFLTYAKLIGQNGDDAVTAAENFESNLAEIQRYLTEDATGVYTFFDDAIAKEKDLGVALKDDGGYQVNIKNMQEFAKEMGRTTEFCENMILALHDAGELEIDLSVISDGIRSDLSDLGSAPLNATKTIEHAIESINRMGDSEENALNKIVLGRKAADAYLNDQIEKETVEQYNQSFSGEVQISNNGAVITDAEQTKKAIGGLTQEVQRYHDEADAATRTDLFKNLREDVRALSSLDRQTLIKAGVDIDENATKEQIIDKLGELTQMSELEKLSLKLDIELPDSLTDDEVGKVQALYDAYNALNELKVQPNVSTDELSQAQQKVVELAQALEGEDRKEFLAHFGIVTDESGIVQVEATKQKLGEPVESRVTYYAPQSVVDSLNQMVQLIDIIDGEHDSSVTVETEYAEEQLQALAEQLTAWLNENKTVDIGFKADENGEYSVSSVLQQAREKIKAGTFNVPIGIDDTGLNKDTVHVNVSTPGAAQSSKEVQALTNNLNELAAVGAVNVSVSVGGALVSIVFLNGALDALGAKVTQPMVSMNLAKFYSDEKVVDATLRGLSGKTASPHVSLDYQSFIRGAGAVSAGMSSISSLSAYPHVSLSGGSYVDSLLDSIRTKMNSLDGRTSTMYINTVRNSSSGGGKYTDALGTVHANASGTANAYAGGTPNNTDVTVKRDETALVNEVGTESIVHNGKWSLIPGGAKFVNLKKGDINNSVLT